MIRNILPSYQKKALDAIGNALKTQKIIKTRKYYKLVDNKPQQTGYVVETVEVLPQEWAAKAVLNGFFEETTKDISKIPEINFQVVDGTKK